MSKLAKSLPTLGEILEEPKKLDVEIKQVSLKLPALVGLRNRTPIRNVNLRLLTREAIALAVLVEGFDNELHDSVGSKSAGPQDFLRYLMSQAADQLGL
jgi:hypothetical protein